MADKKDTFKFTIQFSPGDPHHRQTAQLLNEQGRRKAQFIVNAVTHYINCKETPEAAAPTLDRATIEAVVLQILEQRIPQPESAPQEAAPTSKSQRPLRKSESIRFGAAADALGEDGIDAIMSSLSAIQSGK